MRRWVLLAAVLACCAACGGPPSEGLSEPRASTVALLKSMPLEEAAAYRELLADPWPG